MASNKQLNAGGRVAIQLDGLWYHPVADVVVESTGIEPESVVNQDGSVQRTVKPKARKCTLTFRDFRGLNMDRLVEAAGFDVTVNEIDMKRRVLFTNAFVEGAVSRNTQNGEISGITVVSDQVKVIERS